MVDDNSGVVVGDVVVEIMLGDIAVLLSDSAAKVIGGEVVVVSSTT